MQVFLMVLFSLGFLVVGVLSTRTELLFSWPTLALLGIPAALSLVQWKTKPKFSPSDLGLVLALITAGYFAGRALTSPVAYLGRTDLTLIGFCFLVYAMVSTVFVSPSQRRILFWVIGLLGVGNLVVAAIHFSGSWGFHILPQYVRTYAPGRVGGFYNNPNHLAASLEVVLFLLLGVACFGRGGAARRLLLFFFAGLCVIGIILSVSRGAFIATSIVAIAFLVASILLVWFLHPFRFGRIVMVGGGVVALAVASILLVMPNLVSARFSLDRFVDSKDIRVYLWEAANGQHALAPWLGTGSRTFEYFSRQFRPDDVPGHMTDALYAHNDWLQTRAEYGWIGLLLISVCLLVHLVSGGRFLAYYIRELLPGRSSPGSVQVGLCVGSMAALAVLMVHAIFEFHMHIPSVAVLASFCMGLLANPGFGRRAVDEGSFRIPMLRYGYRAVTAVVGILAVGGAVRFLPGEIAYEQSRFVRPYENLGLEKVNFLNRSKEKDGKHYEAFYNSGLARLNMMRPKMPVKMLETITEKAHADFLKVQELYPQHIFNLVMLGDSLDALGRHDEAGEVFAGALAMAPQHQNILVAYGTHFHRIGNFEKAREMYRRCGSANAYGESMKVNLAAARKRLVRDEQRAKDRAAGKSTSMR